MLSLISFSFIPMRKKNIKKLLTYRHYFLVFKNRLITLDLVSPFLLRTIPLAPLEILPNMMLSTRHYLKNA
jgi:hypothetical protein